MDRPCSRATQLRTPLSGGRIWRLAVKLHPRKTRWTKNSTPVQATEPKALHALSLYQLGEITQSIYDISETLLLVYQNLLSRKSIQHKQLFMSMFKQYNSLLNKLLSRSIRNYLFS